jgi:hypothetical protein
MIEITDSTPLFEKLMNHFGWYKTKKVDMVVENMDVHYTLNIKDEEVKLPETDAPWPFPAPQTKRKPALKKATTRKVKNAPKKVSKS